MDIKNKRIGSFSRNSGSYKTLEKILSINKSLGTNTIVPIDNLDKSTLLNKLISKDIDLFFGIVSNPDPIFLEISKAIPIKIFGVDGIDNKFLKLLFPNFNKTLIDSTNYKLETNRTINTLQTGISLICNKDLEPLETYLLIKTVFGNFSYIKNNGNDIYKLQMFDFNPSYLYNVNYSVELHSGVRKYLKDINLITTNSNEDCIYKVGIEKCNLKYINGYRLL